MPHTLSNGIPIPEVPLSFVPVKAGEVIQLGPVTCRILEDGSNTDNRLGAAELILPPRTPGPPPHWHEMHDETFLITQGKIRFHVPEAGNPGEDKKVVDASVGDYVVIPVKSPHTFGNPHDEEARIFFTTTPSFYINYFKLLSTLSEPNQPVPAEVNMTAMAMYATTLVDKQPRTN